MSPRHTYFVKKFTSGHEFQDYVYLRLAGQHLHMQQVLSGPSGHQDGAGREPAEKEVNSTRSPHTFE